MKTILTSLLLISLSVQAQLTINLNKGNKEYQTLTIYDNHLCDNVEYNCLIWTADIIHSKELEAIYSYPNGYHITGYERTEVCLTDTIDITLQILKSGYNTLYFTRKNFNYDNILLYDSSFNRVLYLAEFNEYSFFVDTAKKINRFKIITDQANSIKKQRQNYRTKQPINYYDLLGKENNYKKTYINKQNITIFAE